MTNTLTNATLLKEKRNATDGNIIFVCLNDGLVKKIEKKVYTFHAVFRVDVNDVKPFQNPTGRPPFDHYLDPL